MRLTKNPNFKRRAQPQPASFQRDFQSTASVNVLKSFAKATLDHSDPISYVWSARRTQMKTRWLSVAALTVSLAAPASMIAARANAAELPPAAPAYQDRPWDQPPDEYRDVQRQGFHDGIESARRDWERHSGKDADDHDLYRHPPVDRQFAHDYRDAFKHGYSEAKRHMQDERRDSDHDRPY
jgi:hypothetical protein